MHFRDIRDILRNMLTFWFFATPIIYPYQDPTTRHWLAGRLLKLNPFTHLAIVVSGDPVFRGPCRALKWLLVLGAISVVFFLFGYFVFDRLRDTFAEEVNERSCQYPVSSDELGLELGTGTGTVP